MRDPHLTCFQNVLWKKCLEILYSSGRGDLRFCEPWLRGSNVRIGKMWPGINVCRTPTRQKQFKWTLTYAQSHLTVKGWFSNHVLLSVTPFLHSYADTEFFILLPRAKISNLPASTKFMRFPPLFSMIFYVVKA